MPVDLAVEDFTARDSNEPVRVDELARYIVIEERAGRKVALEGLSQESPGIGGRQSRGRGWLQGSVTTLGPEIAVARGVVRIIDAAVTVVVYSVAALLARYPFSAFAQSAQVFRAAHDRLVLDETSARRDELPDREPFDAGVAYETSQSTSSRSKKEGFVLLYDEWRGRSSRCREEEQASGRQSQETHTRRSGAERRTLAYAAIEVGKSQQGLMWSSWMFEEFLGCSLEKL
jgi:hypothetical protein